jgi:hypothetical protein
VGRGFPFEVIEGFNNDDEIKKYLEKHDFVIVPEIQASPDYYQFQRTLDEMQKFSLAEAGVTKEATTTAYLKVEGTYKLPIKEVRKYLANSELGYIKSTQDEFCKTNECSNVYLLSTPKFQPTK